MAKLKFCIIQSKVFRKHTGIQKILNQTVARPTPWRVLMAGILYGASNQQKMNFINRSNCLFIMAHLI